MNNIVTPEEWIVLQSFANSTCQRIGQIYNSGKSGARVMLADFSSPDYKGLNGSYVIKFGTYEWANQEDRLYNLVLHDKVFPHIATLVAITKKPKGRDLAAVAYRMDHRFHYSPSLTESIIGLESNVMKYVVENIVSFAFSLYRTQRPSKRHLTLYSMLVWMLSEKRMADLETRISQHVPTWMFHVPYIQLGVPRNVLPNPLYFFHADKFVEQVGTWTCPIGHIHGDLYTGNVIYHSQTSDFRVIDFGEYRRNGIPLFDLAYLEFDIIRQLLPVSSNAEKFDFWFFIKHVMHELIPGNFNIIPGTRKALDLIMPIRRQVKDFIYAAGSDKRGYELTWWMATYAVGLNYARKNDTAKTQNDWTAALLYAAFSLHHVLKITKLNVSQNRKKMPLIQWIDEHDYYS